MSANILRQRLELECSALTWLRALFISVVLLSLWCILLLPLALPLVLLLLSFTIAVAWRCWRQRCELGAEPVRLVWDAEGRWRWFQKGEEAELALCGDSYLSSAVVILNFTYPETRHRRSLVLSSASVGADRFRRLRVRLLLDGARSVRGGHENFPG